MITIGLFDHRLPDRFWDRIIPEPNSGCWLWTGGGSVYGVYWRDGKSVGAHVAAFEALVSPIPAGLELDHRCRFQLCCNPMHLEAVTHEVNAQRRSAAITHCPNGHQLTSIVNNAGRRWCRVCHRDRARAKRAAI